MTAVRAGDRAFGLVAAGLLAALAAIGFAWSGRVPVWAAGASAGALALALLAPGLLMPLNRLWSRLAARIAFVSNHVLLGSFFALVVVPFGLAARLFGSRSVRKGPDPAVRSYWTPVSRQATAETYPDLF